MVKNTAFLLLMMLIIFLSPAILAQKNELSQRRHEISTELVSFSSLELGRELLKSREAIREDSKRNLGFWDIASSDDVIRGSEVLSILEKRKKEGDKEATYQHARYNAILCEQLLSVKKVYAESTCSEMEMDLRSIANNDHRAMILLAVMYEEGIWFEQSKFAASDWYLKLAEYYERRKQQEMMFTNLEKSLRLNPNSKRAKDFFNRVM